MPLPTLVLRPYQRTDFEAVLAIDQACFPKGISYGRQQMRSYLQSEGAHCILAEVSGVVVGFILTDRLSELAHIVTLDVLPAWHRKSIGSALLRAAEDQAASLGASLMYLETATTNKAAIALWNKHGYRETGTIENYYGRGQNAFEMQKRLERKFHAKQN